MNDGGSIGRLYLSDAYALSFVLDYLPESGTSCGAVLGDDLEPHSF